MKLEFKGVRVNLKMIFTEPFYFDRDYKLFISDSLKEFGLKYFTFSDIFGKKIKAMKEGFYAIGEAKFAFSTLYSVQFYKVLSRLASRGLKFTYGTARNIRLDVTIVDYFDECHPSSPVIVMDENKKDVAWNENPVLYSSLIRNKLVKKYVEIFGSFPKNNSFFIVPFEQKQKEGTEKRTSQRLKFKLYGSEEIIYLANCLGIGDKNEEGFGMLSKSKF